jgi:hypothetical protein
MESTQIQKKKEDLNIEAIYEPMEIEEMFASTDDKLIKETDIPERMQLKLK